MTKRALIVRGGWSGHTPTESTDHFVPQLRSAGFEVEIAEGTARYAAGGLEGFDLIVQCVTMSTIEKDEWAALSAAVRSGVGFAGWHGGIIDSFRQNTEYQWMTGGQWVAHPGNCIPEYRVEIVDPGHEITTGLGAFTLRDTEQYYIHVDPGVHVLCRTTFSGEHGDASLYPAKVVMPYAWTRRFGKARVFVACWGHTFKDFEVPEANELVRRGLLWAARTDQP